jgi:DNA-binding MurR/RpiR family transcriptional regulator
MKLNASIDFVLSNAAITEKIAGAYPSLSSTHQKAADYVLANPFRAATMTIDEFAGAVGMSIATGNRFARALGFDGYPQFRAEMVQAFKSTLAPVEKLRTELLRDSSCVEIFSASLQEDLDNIQGTLHRLDPTACERAVDMILRAPRIYILGFSTSACLASIIAHRLEPYCSSVQLIATDAGPPQAALRLFKVNSEDLVIAIAFPHYTRITVELLGLAATRGAKVLAITDAPTSPIVKFADTVLYAKSERRLSANSDAGALALMEALCGAVVHRSKNSLRTATALTEWVLPYLYDDQPCLALKPPRVGGRKLRA